MERNQIAETIICGVTGVVFAVALFFSIMYPEYGIRQKTGPYGIYEGRNKIVYASYFYDCFRSGS